MEKSLDGLVRQAKNNINIISLVPIDEDKVAVLFEFQYRPKAGASPHWVKSCVITSVDLLVQPDMLYNLVIAATKHVRAGLEE